MVDRLKEELSLMQVMSHEALRQVPDGRPRVDGRQFMAGS